MEQRPENPSYWRVPAFRPALPELRGDERCGVAIVGGGLTGITLAALLSERGADAAVVEADALGAGTTGGTTGKITLQHGLKYHALAQALGADNARLYARANQAGFDLIAGFVKTLHMDCDYTPSEAYVYTEDDGDVAALEKELKALDALGLEAFYREDCGLPFPIRAAVSVKDQAHFHPMKYLHALAAHAISKGCRIYEHSQVVSVERGSGCTLKTANGGTLRAQTVVLATNYPIKDMPGFYFARLHQERSYIVCADAPGIDVRGMYINVRPPVHSFRMHNAQKPRLLAGGYGHKTGHQGEGGSYTRLRALLKDRFPEGCAPIAQWSAQDTVTLDGVPYAGTLSRETPDIFIATGYAKWGMTNSAACALLLAESITDTGGMRDEAALFSPHRFTPGASAKSFLVQSLDIAKSFTAGNLSIPFGDVQAVPGGEGKIMGADHDAVAVYKDEAGDVHVYSAHCTHMKCPLAYNAEEKSFDCPCHGSRFAMDGSVLNGPAPRPLKRRDVRAKE